MANKKNKTKTATIATNRKAHHDYFIEQRFEAGMVLQGWEVKSLRQGRAQLKESYITFREGAAWLFGAHISPLESTCTHYEANPTRTRKLLLNQKEFEKLFGSVKKEGLTAVPLNLHWKKHYVKCELALARGKKLHDKRRTSKDRDWQRDKARIVKSVNK